MSLVEFSAWYKSLFTGLFTAVGPTPLRAHDPNVPIWSGESPLPGPGGEPPATGGAGWDDESAELACVGEAIERWQAWPLPCDRIVAARFASWPLDEPAIAPDRFVLFHPEQYARRGFPYRPFKPETECDWICTRQALTGLPFWVPSDFVYLSHVPTLIPSPSPGGRGEKIAQLCPLISSGLACGRWNQPILLRGLQETIERDAVVGASWGRYPLEEHLATDVFGNLGPEFASRLIRPNLRYRFLRVDTPFSGTVTIVTLEGEDREGYCFSVGAACRETLAMSWRKSLLEAVQGRHYVRYLKARLRAEGRGVDVPASFADHAVYYSLYPERLRQTVLRGEAGRSPPAPHAVGEGEQEDIAVLVKRLGPERPVLFRNMTPPALAMEKLDWLVLRVIVPGLQPLHGHHALPFLGGPLWAPRGWKEWESMQPHPFP